MYSRCEGEVVLRRAVHGYSSVTACPALRRVSAGVYMSAQQGVTIAHTGQNLVSFSAVFVVLQYQVFGHINMPNLAHLPRAVARHPSCICCIVSLGPFSVHEL